MIDHARKCKMLDVSTATARSFANENHLQGYVVGKNIGLIYNDELVGLLVYGKARFNKQADLELLRVCFKRDCNVVGGTSKLLAQLKRLEPGKLLISYHDRCWGTTSVYDKLGFVKRNVSVPSYVYVKYGVVLSRWQAQKHKLKDLLGDKFDASLTEAENMQRARYMKVYDCGQDVLYKQL